jgi:hypothetical protein
MWLQPPCRPRWQGQRAGPWLASQPLVKGFRLTMLLKCRAPKALRDVAGERMVGPIAVRLDGRSHAAEPLALGGLKLISDAELPSEAHQG